MKVMCIRPIDPLRMGATYTVVGEMLCACGKQPEASFLIEECPLGGLGYFSCNLCGMIHPEPIRHQPHIKSRFVPLEPPKQDERTREREKEEV